VELSTGHHSPYRWCGNLIKTLFACGARGSCPLPEALTRLPTPFQSLPSNDNSITSAWDKFCTCTVHPWVATRQQALTTVFPCEDSRCLVSFVGMSIRFLKQKAVGSRLILQAPARPSRSPYYSGATLRVRLLTPSFFDVTSTCQKPASVTSLLDLSIGQHSNLP
jgi:hypothetical protein